MYTNNLFLLTKKTTSKYLWAYKDDIQLPDHSKANQKVKNVIEGIGEILQ